MEEELEQSLELATDTLEESSHEIVRLHAVVMAMHAMLKEHGIDFDPEKMYIGDLTATNVGVAHDGTHSAPIIGRSVSRSANVDKVSLKVSQIRSTISSHVTSATIVEDDEEDDLTSGRDWESGAISGHVMDFENIHLREKLSKVLHTVDCLNDTISDLREEIRRKASKIQALEAKLNQS